MVELTLREIPFNKLLFGKGYFWKLINNHFFIILMAFL